MSQDESKDEPKSGEVLPPKDPPPEDKAIYNQLIASITQYTDRPDLFLEAIERHDPGFIKRMNEESSSFSKKNREARFNFGQFQAYVTLGISGVAALVILAALVYLIYAGHASFWSIVGLALFYAVTQSGSKGFLSIIEGIKGIISGHKTPKE